MREIDFTGQYMKECSLRYHQAGTGCPHSPAIISITTSTTRLYYRVRWSPVQRAINTVVRRLCRSDATSEQCPSAAY